MAFESFVDEAIGSLGYVKPEARAEIIAAIEATPNASPSERARYFRKQGDQISKEEKKALGLRANAFFSRTAFDSLTDHGRSDPISALEVTFLRAVFSKSREDAIKSAEKLQAEFGEHLEITLDTFIEGCPGCKRLNGVSVTPSEARDMLPPKDCIREACPASVSANVDYIGYSVKESTKKKKGLIARIFGR